MAGVVTVFAGSLTASLLWPTPAVLVPAFLLNTLLGVLVFTPLHEACHGIASRSRRLNEAVMYACWPFFLHSPFLFREIHNQHHAHTGDDPHDPDSFTKRKTLAGQWAASMFLVFHYYVRYVREGRSKAHVVISLAGPVGMLGLALSTDLGPALLSAWVLPNFFAIGILAYINTALPHAETPATSRIDATRILEVPRLAEMVMCAQNLHLVHHLKPTLPWYKYRAYWHEHEARLRAKGAIVSYNLGACPVPRLSPELS